MRLLWAIAFSMAVGVGFAVTGGGMCVLILVAFGFEPAWPAIVWASLCGFAGGFLAGWEWPPLDGPGSANGRGN